MAKYYQQWDDFNTYTIGTNIANHTARGAIVDRKPKYGTLLTVPVKRRFLKIGNTANAWAGVSLDAVDSDANRATVSAATCVIIDQMTTDNVYLFIRGAGGVTGGVYAQINKSTNTFALGHLIAGAGTLLNSTSVTWQTGHSYFITVTGSGTAVSAKVWDAALGKDGYSTASNLLGTTTVTAAGWVGLAQYNLTSTLEEAGFNFLSVATNGDAIVIPRTNRDYSNWLEDQSASRVILAKMNYLKYNSSGTPAYTQTGTVYLSNYGYTSQSYDSPANTHFNNYITSVPTFAREMPVALSGTPSLNFGQMIVSNPIDTTVALAQALEFKFTMAGGGGNEYNYWKIAQPSYVIPAGSRLEYDFYIDPANPVINNGPGGVEVDLTTAPTNGRTAGWVDTLGDTCQSLNSFAPHYVGGVWYTRTLPFVASMIGKTISNFAIASEADTAGNYRALYRNIRITNASGVTLLTLWNGGQPTYNVVDYGNGASATTVKVVNASMSANATPNPGSKGVRDNWLRVRWDRDGFEMLHGDPSWPLHDFRHLIRGRVGNPTAPTKSLLQFPLSDMSEFFNKPLVTEKYTTGDYIDQYKPLLIGRVSNHIEPPLIDPITRKYQLSKITSPATLLALFHVYNNGIEILGIATSISAVNIGTDVMTSAVNHGMTAGYVVQFQGAAPPAGLSTFVNYYVIAAGLTLNTFSLSATQGGAAVNLTGAGTGAGFRGQGWDTNYSDATFTLADSPGENARITVSEAKVSSAFGIEPDLFNQAVFEEGALSLNYKDQATFDNFSDTGSGASFTYAGLWVDTQLNTLQDVIGRIQTGLQAWSSFTADGLYQIGTIIPPVTAPVKYFTESNISLDGVRMVDRIRPIDQATTVMTYGPAFLTNGPFESTDPALKQGYSVYNPYVAPSPVAPPLDNFPAEADPNTVSRYDFIYSIAAGGFSRIKDLFSKPVGIFEFDTTLYGLDVNIGDVVSVDYPRMEWKQWSSTDPVSPDNPANVDDSKLATVIGTSVNMDSAGAFKVKIKCFRHILGYYPDSDLS